MQYLVIFTPNPTFATAGRPADFMAKELQEQAQVRVLYAGGGARQVWAHYTDTDRKQVAGGVVLFEADTPAHLEEQIHSFPLVRANYATYQTLPLGPHAAFRPPAAS